jgi:hypothetical protein
MRGAAMTKRKWFVVTVGLLLVVVASVGTLTAIKMWRADPIDSCVLDGVQPGMTDQEVERLIGLPPGDYGGGRWAGKMGTLRDWEEPQVHAYSKSWAGETAVIQVNFDATGHVHHSVIFQMAPETFIARMRRRLGL